MIRKGNKLVLMGPAGSFSDEAANLAKIKSKLHDFKKIYVSSFEKIFSSVRRPGFYGLIPVKNKIIGEIKTSAALVKKFSREFHEVYRFRLAIKFVIAAKAKVQIKKIESLYLARIAQLQCKNFIKNKLPRAKINSNRPSRGEATGLLPPRRYVGGASFFPSTSSAVKKIIRLKKPGSAAIGSKYAAKMYGLKVLASNIQDSVRDWTEFVLFDFKIPK